MDLRGRYLILMTGLDGTRRTDIAHLLAGGAAYLSTVTEYTSPDAQSSAQAKPAYHTKVTVLSTLDCFEGKRGAWEYNHNYLPQAREDVKRRCELAMSRSVSVIIIDDIHNEKWEVQPYLQLAAKYEYEVIALGTLDARPDVMDKRRAQTKRSLPEDRHEKMRKIRYQRSWDTWSVHPEDGSFVNEEDRQGRLIQPDRGDPTQVVDEAPKVSEVDSDYKLVITGVPARNFGHSQMARVWKFVQEITGCKIHEARALVSVAMAAEEGPINPPVMSVMPFVAGSDPDRIIKRGKEIGLELAIAPDLRIPEEPK